MIQRWAPTLSPMFPSQIPFWIRLHGLPIHYWHEKMIYNIGQDLGILEDYHISKTSARIRVSVDGLKPIVKADIIEFGSGEELHVTLAYDDLENHCSYCNHLDHGTRRCPLMMSAKATANRTSSREVSEHHYQQHSSPSFRRASSNQEDRPATQRLIPSQSSDFSNRVDRHGRPFGARALVIPPRGQPLRNKVTPPSPSHRRTQWRSHLSTFQT